jgi:NAD(P)-dependent dehydrogenase (short-subunit alcohol dehydrogenase family)
MLSGYCASKHAIEAIVDCARRETHDQGLDIVLVEPGVIMTPLLDVSLEGARSAAGGLGPGHRAIYGPLYDSYARLIEREAPKGTTVEAAADVIEKAAFTPRPRTRYAIGKDAKGVIALSRLLSDRALDFVFRKMYGV